MNEEKIVLVCPLGAKCWEYRADKNGETVRHQCAWFTTLGATKGDEVVEEKACALQFLPSLLVENIHVQRGTTAATEDLRNEVVTGSCLTNNILLSKINPPTYLQ